MDVISRTVTTPSGLNPNAPMFVSAAYKAVEDFSDEWWNLIKSSKWYQQYWWIKYKLKETKNKHSFAHVDDHVIHDPDSLVDIKEEEEKDYNKNLVTLGALKWRNMRTLAETPRFAEKAPKIVNKKMIPRPIQPPR